MEDFTNTTSEPRVSGITPLAFVFGLVAALVFGGVIGYGLGLYQAAQQPPEVVEVVVTATPNPQAVAQAETAAENEAGAPAGNASPTPDIMDFLLSDARHFQGEAAAPVTIIEFSDFK